MTIRTVTAPTRTGLAITDVVLLRCIPLPRSCGAAEHLRETLQRIRPASRVERETLLRRQPLVCDGDLSCAVDVVELDGHERLAARAFPGPVPRPRVDDAFGRLDLVIDAAHRARLAAGLHGDVPGAAHAQVDAHADRDCDRSAEPAPHRVRIGPRAEDRLAVEREE